MQFLYLALKFSFAMQSNLKLSILLVGSSR